MTVEEFDRLVAMVLEYLERDSHDRPERYERSGEDFETCVREGAERALATLGINGVKVRHTLNGHQFPDIVLECDDGDRYGIEVKSSVGAGASWRIAGNSVLGGTSVPGIVKNVIIFGKMRREGSEFRSREYERCVTEVRVTHSPRYMIDLDTPEGESFFDKSGLDHSVISEADDPIGLIAEYYRSQGYKAWWLPETAPMLIRTFGELSVPEKAKVVGYAFAHYFEVFSSSTDKYRRCANWLATENSVIDSSLRDRFSAGGRCNVTLSSGAIYFDIAKIFKTLHENRRHVLRELRDADLAKLGEDWEVRPKENAAARESQWLALASAAIDERFANGYDKRKMLADIVGDPE